MSRHSNLKLDIIQEDNPNQKQNINSTKSIDPINSALNSTKNQQMTFQQYIFSQKKYTQKMTYQVIKNKSNQQTEKNEIQNLQYQNFHDQKPTYKKISSKFINQLMQLQIDINIEETFFCVQQSPQLLLQYVEDLRDRVLKWIIEGKEVAKLLIDIENNINNHKLKLHRDLRQLEIKCESYHKNVALLDFITKSDAWHNLLYEEQIIFKEIEILQKQINENTIYLTQSQLPAKVTRTKRQKLMKFVLEGSGLMFQRMIEKMKDFQFTNIKIDTNSFTEYQEKLGGQRKINSADSYQYSTCQHLVNFFLFAQNQCEYMEMFDIFICYEIQSLKERLQKANHSIDLVHKQYQNYFNTFRKDCENLLHEYNQGRTNIQGILINLRQQVFDIMKLKLPYNQNKESNDKIIQLCKSNIRTLNISVNFMEEQISTKKHQKRFFITQGLQDKQHMTLMMNILQQQIEEQKVLIEQMQNLELYEQTLNEIRSTGQRIKHIYLSAPVSDELVSYYTELCQCVTKLVQTRSLIGSQQLFYTLQLFPIQMIKLDNDIQNQIMEIENLKDAIEICLQKQNREQFQNIDDHLFECRNQQKFFEKILESKEKFSEEQLRQYHEQIYEKQQQLQKNKDNPKTPGYMQKEIQELYQQTCDTAYQLMIYKSQDTLQELLQPSTLTEVFDGLLIYQNSDSKINAYITKINQLNAFFQLNQQKSSISMDGYQLTQVLLDYLHSLLENYTRLRIHLIKKEDFKNIEEEFRIFYEKQIQILSQNTSLDILKPNLDNYIKINKDWYLNHVAVFNNELLFSQMKDKLLIVNSFIETTATLLQTILRKGYYEGIKVKNYFLIKNFETIFQFANLDLVKIQNDIIQYDIEINQNTHKHPETQDKWQQALQHLDHMKRQLEVCIKIAKQIVILFGLIRKFLNRANIKDNKCLTFFKESSNILLAFDITKELFLIKQMNEVFTNTVNVTKIIVNLFNFCYKNLNQYNHYDSKLQEFEYQIDINNEPNMYYVKKLINFIIQFEEQMKINASKDMDFIQTECQTLYNPLLNFHKNYQEYIYNFLKLYDIEKFKEIQIVLDQLKPFDKNLDELKKHMKQIILAQIDLDSDSLNKYMEFLLKECIFIDQQLLIYKQNMILLKPLHEYFYKIPADKRPRLSTFVRLTKQFNPQIFDKWAFLASKLIEVLKSYTEDCQNPKKNANLKQKYQLKLESIQDQIKNEEQIRLIEQFTKFLMAHQSLE